MKHTSKLPVVIAVVCATTFVLFARSLSFPTTKTSSFSTANEDTLRLSPTVLAPNEKGELTPLALNECDIKITSNGALVETEMTLVYENKSSRLLEGTFYFPLKADQFITHLSLEQKEGFRDASVVTKETGRVAFEATERKQIDPALLEWAAGNSVKLRVYPIPARGTKRIRIRYAQPLKQDDSGLYFDLPLHFKDRMKRFSIRANFPADQTFKASSLDPKLNKNSSFWEYAVTQQDVFANQSIRFYNDLEHTSHASMSSVNGSSYLVSHFKLPTTSRSKKSPKSMSILWDVSSSSKDRDFEREQALFVSYLNGLEDCDIHLVQFSNEVHIREDIHWQKGNDASLLFLRLRNSTFDGATQLGSIPKSDLKGEEILLFSDCMSNFGSDSLKTTPSQRVYVLTSSPTFDMSRARRMTKFNGDVIQMADFSTVDCLKRLQQEQLRLLHVEGIPDSLVTGLGLPVDPFFMNALKMPVNPPQKISYQFGIGDEVLSSFSVDVPKYDAGGNLSERFWANERLKDLDVDFEKNQQEMTSLALKHALVCRYTSLLVLEDLEDYIKFKIVPPAELQKEYYSRLKLDAENNAENTRDHDQEVMNRWEEIKKWYTATYQRSATDSIRVQTLGAVNSVQEVYMVTDGVEEMEVMNFTTTANREDRGLFAEAEKKEKISESKVSVSLEAWKPDTPYMRALRKADKLEAYKTYLSEKAVYANQPSFYLDVADYFVEIGEKKLALRILSNLAELELENPQLLRVLAHRLDQMEEYALAQSVFEEVKTLRPEEPQSFRDLALILEKRGMYKEAVTLLQHVVANEWDDRFRDIEVIALVEMNHLLTKYEELKNQVEKKYIYSMPVDTRVILTWDTDNCDIDLWVTDPYGEKCFYSHALTQLGGRISADCTGGYGPEEFMLKSAHKGKYKVQANYYGSRGVTVTGPTTIQLKMYTNYGKPNEKVVEITRRLESTKEILDIGEFVIE